MLRNDDMNVIEALREQCRRDGREVLTPKAAMVLFGISDAAVRAARLHGKVKPELTIAVTDKPVHLISLDSALRFWKLPDDMQGTLARMRQYGTTAAVGPEFYNILHADKVVKLNEPRPAESEAARPRRSLGKPSGS